MAAGPAPAWTVRPAGKCVDLRIRRGVQDRPCGDLPAGIVGSVGREGRHGAAVAARLSPRPNNGWSGRPDDDVRALVSVAAGADDLIDRVAALGGTVQAWDRETGLLSVDLPAARLGHLAELSSVVHVDADGCGRGHRVSSAAGRPPPRRRGRNPRRYRTGPRPRARRPTRAAPCGLGRPTGRVRWSSSATMPATCGAAMLVPLIVVRTGRTCPGAVGSAAQRAGRHDVGARRRHLRLVAAVAGSAAAARRAGRDVTWS